MNTAALVDPLVGRIFAGKYELEERIRSGSMGAIYRARHLGLDKVVCVKIMLDDIARDPKLAARFQREARAASRLDHPGSVHVLDHGKEEDGTLYIAMEFIDGRDLYELLADGPFSTTRIVDIMTQTLSALAAAHDVGILHRDLKPENIMVVTTRGDDGELVERVKVCDFGIAHMADPATSGSARLTMRGFIIGTPEYMSPEQARADAPDPRSDLYSAGVILFHLLTGQLPFEADTPIGVALKHLHEPPPRPRDLHPDADPTLEAICLRAMKKNPEERFSSAREMRSAIRAVLAGRSSDELTNDDSHMRLRRPPLLDSLPVPVGAGTPIEPLALSVSHLPERPRGRRRLVASVIVLAAAAAILATAQRARIRPELLRAASPIATVTRPDVIAPAPVPPPVAPTVVVPSPVEPSPTTTATTTTTTPTATTTNAPPPPRTAAPHSPARTTKGAEKPSPAPAPVSVAAEPAPENAASPVPAPPSPAPESATPAPTPAAAPSPAAPPPSPSPTPPPMPPRFVIESARVEIGAPTRLLGATSVGLDRALAPARAKIDACYRSALPALPGALDGAGALHLETDDVGVIRRAHLDGALAGELGSCVTKAILGTKIAHVDTGTATADLPLVYRPR